MACKIINLFNNHEIIPRYGNIHQSTQGPQQAREEYPNQMVGIGAFMEGIDQNYVMYDAFYISFHLP